jgi:hypothetical protein
VTKQKRGDSDTEDQSDPKGYPFRILNQNVPAQEWLAVKPHVIKDGAPCLRLMVQYPMKATRTAAGGQKYHQDTNEACTEGNKDKEGKKCGQLHDYLVTVHILNAERFLTGEVVPTLERNTKKSKKAHNIA